jgi:polyisoprenoid-binding protein YceI
VTQRPRRSRPIVWLGTAVVIAVLAVGAYGLWYLFLRPAGPPPVSISDVTVPSASADASTPGSSAASSGPAATSAAASSGSSGASAGSGSSGSSAATGSSNLSGTWNVDSSLGSFVGYRVQEQLASIGANTAVGRTSGVTGTLTLDGSTVTAVDITADMTQLQSDDQRRDGQLRNQGIQYQQYPTAEFKLTQPIALGSIPADGQTVSATATGDLTLHGVTKSVEIPLQAKVSDGHIIVTGSLPIAFADYNIQAPTSFAVLSVRDHGTMELQLLFTKG